MGAFVLGMPFSVAICPFCTPALVVLLGVVAGIGSPGFGALLLFAFALGRAIPILLGAAAVGWLEGLSGLSRFHKVFEVTGGVLLILSGFYLLNAYFLVLPSPLPDVLDSIRLLPQQRAAGTAPDYPRHCGLDRFGRRVRRPRDHSTSERRNSSSFCGLAALVSKRVAPSAKASSTSSGRLEVE